MRTEPCAYLPWSVSFSTREAPHFLNTEQWLTRLRHACQRMTLLVRWRYDAKPCAVVERGENLLGPLWVMGGPTRNRPSRQQSDLSQTSEPNREAEARASTLFLALPVRIASER